MKHLRQKRPRLRLDPEQYRTLRNEALKRDGWRCQNCGSLKELQVHHVKARSALGDDMPDNLITLCMTCHEQYHRCCKHAESIVHTRGHSGTDSSAYVAA